MSKVRCCSRCLCAHPIANRMSRAASRPTPKRSSTPRMKSARELWAAAVVMRSSGGMLTLKCRYSNATRGNIDVIITVK